MTIHTRQSDRTEPRRRPAAAAFAFTLTELLVVIALSALLLALLFGPLVQGFRLTNRARAQVAAQEATRIGLEQLTRELRQAAYVFDNSNTPIVLPLEAPANPLTGTTPAANVARANTYQINAAGDALVAPLEQYGRIDFVASDIRSRGGDPVNGVDPTTQRPVGGGQLRLPLAAGTRYTRYWIGLRRNTLTGAGGAVAPAFYSNVYEFPRDEADFNPFVLWRAEYDPTDVNLVDPTVRTDDTTRNEAGLNDPNFFYNTRLAPNGLTYAENWRAIATPVVSGTNLDLLAWRRTSRRVIDTRNPYQTGVNFAPATILGDAATPGFLTASQAEAPSAVPTLYGAQYGQWVLPFGVTVYRGATQYSGGAGGPRYGRVQLQFEIDGPNLVVRVRDSSGTLLTPVSTSDPQRMYYWMRSPRTGRYFVKVPGLAFWVDPQRGRVETGLPPVAANENGAPLMFEGRTATSPGTIVAMRPANAAGGTFGVGNEGELAEMFFQQSTLHPAAGGAAGASERVPLNQGILFADLAALSPQLNTGTIGANNNIDLGNYYIVGDGSNAVRPSPFLTFGGANGGDNFLGAQIVPGSEQVTGPDTLLFQVGSGTVDPNLTPTAGATATGDVLYSRVPAGPNERVRIDADRISNPATAPNSVYSRRGQVRYEVVQDAAGSYRRPYLLFDHRIGYDNPRALPGPPDYGEVNASGAFVGLNPTDIQALGYPAGLPAAFASVPGSDRKIRVTFQWQNNYARTADGRPADASGRTEAALGTSNQPIRPEPDVMKVDYATRALISIGLTVRVYDSSTGQPQTSQVTDRVRVSNIGR